MENENKQQELLAKNLVYYRKASGLTQLELAEKFNYSDKSISKWERGEGFPDVFVLKSLADFYGITVDDFYLEEHKKISVKHNQKRKQIFIRLLSIGIGMLVTFLTFFLLDTLLPKDAAFKPWLVFIYGLVVCSIIWLVWEFIYHKRLIRMFAVSSLVWTSALAIFLTFLIVMNLPLYFIFIVAIPLQILEILWYFFRRKKNKTGN
jgi:transcriptional regulator with XRE-family HTH domain